MKPMNAGQGGWITKRLTNVSSFERLFDQTINPVWFSSVVFYFNSNPVSV
jgi:hypothetical protein